MNKISKLLPVFLLTAISLMLTTRSLNAQAYFPTKTDFASGQAPYDVATGDINGDGKPDMVSANFSDQTIGIYFNTTTTGSSTPAFSAPTEINIEGNAQYLTLGDINGDGKPDLIVANSTSSNVSVLINLTVTGSSTPAFTVRKDFTTGGKPLAISLKDFNSDGKPDIAAGDQDSAVCVFINNTITGDTTADFSTHYDFSGGLAVFFSASADFNGDGLPDLVSVDGDTKACVFINTTSPGASVPSFTPRTEFQALSFVIAVAVGDFNGDGKQDFVTANDDSISVFINSTTLGSTTPSFSVRNDFATGDLPIDILSCDINRDGKLDIVTVNRGGNSLSVFLNSTLTGSPVASFLTRNDIATLDYPENATFADLNGDGRLDLLAANSGSDSISVFINGTGVGVTPASFTSTDFSMQAGSSPLGITLQDFNGDGKPEMISGDYNNTAISIFVNGTTPGSSGPVFSAAQNFSTGTGKPAHVATGDFNLDGKYDIASVNAEPGGGYIAIFLNATSPGSSTLSFSSHTDFTMANGPRYVQVGDINGDGKPDLVASNGLDNMVSIFLNTTTPGASTPTFSTRTDFATGNEPQTICLADFNGDGKTDFATSNGISNNVSVSFSTTIPGASTPTFSGPTNFAGMGITWALASADFNGDGKPDIAVTTISVDSVAVMLNSTTPGASTPTFYPHRRFSTGTVAYRVASADVNGDGKPDLVTANRNSNDVSVLLNTTTPGTTIPGFLEKSTFSNGFTSNPTDVFIKDLNLDGKPDFAAANWATDNVSVFINRADFPLPVELTSFTASVQNQNVNLKWSTSEEINNKGFDIERNSFGSGWKKIGFVDGHGTVSSPSLYSFNDYGLNKEVYNYRLKQIDYNGNFKYYELAAEVVIGVPVKFELSQNYPNPFNPETIINYQLSVNSFVTLKVFDLAGREVAQLLNEMKPSGYYSIKFNGANLSSGIYFYKIEAGNFSAVKKMVLIK